MNRMSVLAAFALAICAPFSARAKVLYGSLVGAMSTTVPGLLFPDANVTIVEATTGFTRQTQTNQLGQFQFPSVPGGVFKINVERAGKTNP